ncbi:hypothetical protein [Nocardia farcinica]|uniref:hypothetical protein n=1 Tax=Nocardia farcinica TaxID=37329 RepID=UPI0011C0348A|nr:hypothetical protein [Nocardia farcinica]
MSTLKGQPQITVDVGGCWSAGLAARDLVIAGQVGEGGCVDVDSYGDFGDAEAFAQVEVGERVRS